MAAVRIGAEPGLRQRTRWLSSASAVAMLVAASALAPSPVRAETLAEALASAYETNPRLDAERARLRATDEEVPRAESGYRPLVDASAEVGRQKNTTNPESASNGTSNPWGYQLNLTQPIFSGFRTTNAVNEAEANVRAGREDLHQVESETLLDAVRAYATVVREQAILRIRENNVAVLTREFEAAQTRREAREVTKTDVAQAQARRARAISEADLAKANVRIAMATYERVIGHAPAGVSDPPLKMKILPRSLAEALEVAERESPNVISALYREESARYSVDKVWGELLPEVHLEANFSHRGDATTVLEEQEQASITGRVSMPLYEGGEVHARVRQAKHTHVSRLQEIEQARSETQENVTTAWSRLMAARAQLKSDQVQVEANQLALQGVREEERVGQRTLLDVLNAEQELLDAQERLASTKHDLIVAGYALVASTGRLTGQAVIADAVVYDAEQHYHEVRQKWFGLNITDAAGRTQVYDAPDEDDEPADVEE